MKNIFTTYSNVHESLLKGFTVAEVKTGINAAGSGMMLELEREVDNVTLGIDVVYDPEDEDGEALRISQEYVKEVRG